MTENTANTRSKHFIEEAIEQDLAEGKVIGEVHTRFPPEPNGYLHIGHAKSIVLNFSMAEQYNGLCNLRFDDTNPAKEEQEYVDSIRRDIKWLGFDWGDREFFASDYFEQLYDFAVQLIKAGYAYVDEQSQEEIKKQKGVPTEPGTESPYRNRPIEESLELFEKMRNGEYEEGSKVLRAKIDMTSPNMHMRDPAMYRIKHASHHRTGDKWHIYPMYDFAHGQSDALEGISHSLCTLEFENHRPLYNWFIEKLGIHPTRQIEFARLNINYTVLSKRKLNELVELGHVSGWDDPRMPTISGLRRRGFPPESIVNFAKGVGILKRNSLTDFTLLENAARDYLNKTAPRRLGVLKPLKLIVTNFPEGKTETCYATNNPEDEQAGKREINFCRELFIEQSDFMIDPPRKFFRLGPDREVRLKYAYIIKCTGYKTDEQGNVTEVHCTYDPDTKSGQDTTGKKVKGTLGWVCAQDAIDVTVNQYDRLFSDEFPDGHKEKDFKEFLNPASLEVIEAAKLEPGIIDLLPNESVQLERLGYFCLDKESPKDGRIVLNRTVTLRDNWARKK